MTFGESLIRLREENGISRKDLAEKLKIPYTTLRNYEKDQREPGHKLLVQLSSIFSISVDEMLGNTVEKSFVLTSKEQEKIKKYRSLDHHGQETVDVVLDLEWKRCETARQAKVTIQDQKSQMEVADEIVRFIVPRYSMPMSAGTGQPAGKDEHPENFALVKEPPRGTSFIAPVSGDSMEPTYHDGDLVFVYATEEIPIGKIGTFLMDGEQWIKELGEGALISHNPKYDPIKLVEGAKCQGLVLGVCDESYFE